jgi:hypothetical protein
MNTLRKYFVLSLLVAPALMQAAPDDDKSTRNIFSGPANEHYVKVGLLSGVAGAGLGGVLKDYLGDSSANNPVSRAALGGFALASLVRALNHKNPEGLNQSSYPVAVVAGIVFFAAGEGIVAYYTK